MKRNGFYRRIDLQRPKNVGNKGKKTINLKFKNKNINGNLIEFKILKVIDFYRLNKKANPILFYRICCYTSLTIR